MSNAGPLKALAAIPAERAALEARTRELVASARKAGASWGDIGAALQISRQAAHERYGLMGAQIKQGTR